MNSTKYSPVEQVPVEPDQRINNDQISTKPPRSSSGNKQEEGKVESSKRQIYWLIPTYTTSLFLIGIALAIGHYAYLSSLVGKETFNQEWVNRFSLAFPTLVKLCLTSALQAAVCQIVWQTLWKSRAGISIETINSLFSMDTSIFSLLNVRVWRYALIATLLAAGIWLLNFVPVVAPSALSVGLATSFGKSSNCTVPTLNITNDLAGQGLLLQSKDYTGSKFSPSQAAVDLVQSVAVSGLQASWPSPCGSNCSYLWQFNAPSLRCTSDASPYDPAANWTDNGGQNVTTHPWWNGPGDGSNTPAEVLSNGDFMYSPAYLADLNQNTSKFWIGISSPLGDDPSNSTATVSQFLNLTVFFCNIMNTSYDINVTYLKDQQTVILTNLSYINNITIPTDIWQGGFAVSDNRSIIQDDISATVAALYLPLYNLISGSISRDPRSGLVISTDIAEIATLIREVNVSDVGEPTLFYIPDPGMQPHLEELSHNISLSLLANQQLAVTRNATTTCTTSETNLRWKFNPSILIAVYVPAVFVVLASLVLAGLAVLSNGAVRDKNFSTIGVLTTRDLGLNQLVKEDEDGALPLSKEIGRARLIFGEVDAEGVHRRGFVLK